jgi:hypothetical protein
VNPGGLTHPNMLLSLAEFMPSAVTIQAATYTTSGTGVKTAAWATLAGHADLDCRVSPVMSSAPEWQALDTMDLTRAHRTIVLACHPDIEPGMRAVTASTTYTIQSVRHDGSGVMTELLCEEVTIG